MYHALQISVSQLFTRRLLSLFEYSKIYAWSDKLIEGLKLKLRMDDVTKIVQCGTPNP